MKKFEDYSIKKKYTIIIIILSIIPIILLSIVLHNTTIEAIEYELEKTTIMQIASAKYTMYLFTESMINTAFITTPNFARNIEQGDIRSIDRSVFDIYNAFALQDIGHNKLRDANHIVIVVDENGYVISRCDIERVGNKLSSKELGNGFYKALNGTLDYRKMLFDRSFMIMGPQSILVAEGFENFMGHILQKPILDIRGAQVGTLIIISMINNNLELVNMIYHTSNFKFTVYAPDGEVMVSHFQNPPEITPKIIELAQEAINEMIAGTRGTTGKDSIIYTIDRVDLTCPQGEIKSHHFSFVVLPCKDGFISIRGFAIDLTDHDALILERQKYMTSISIISIILISLFGMVFIKKAIFPILNLTNAAKKMSEGDFNVKLPKKTGDEIGQLINAFDFMRLNIKKEQDVIKNIIKFMPYPIFLIYLDNNRKIKYANTELAIWAGYEKIDDIIGHKLKDILNLKDDEVLANIDFESGNKLINKERTLKNKKGTKEFHLVSCLPIYDINKKIIGILEVIINITDLKNTQKNLVMKNKELEDYAYTVAHDLRTPLITIQGFINMLEENIKQNNKEDIAENIKYIKKARSRMDELLSDTLKLSSIDYDTSPYKMILFNNIVSDAIEQLHTNIKAQNIKLIIAQDFPVVFVNKSKTIEVLVNLIENSIKYMGANNSNPIIEIGYKKDENNTVFFVKDNGIGIDPSQHKKIFKVFYKIDVNIDGTGVGLAIVKKIINMYGGDIWIESKKGNGCAFYFTLPIKSQIS